MPLQTEESHEHMHLVKVVLGQSCQKCIIYFLCIQHACLYKLRNHMNIVHLVKVVLGES